MLLDLQIKNLFKICSSKPLTESFHKRLLVEFEGKLLLTYSSKCNVSLLPLTLLDTLMPRKSRPQFGFLSYSQATDSCSVTDSKSSSMQRLYWFAECSPNLTVNRFIMISITSQLRLSSTMFSSSKTVWYPAASQNQICQIMHRKTLKASRTKAPPCSNMNSLLITQCSDRANWRIRQIALVIKPQQTSRGISQSS